METTTIPPASGTPLMMARVTARLVRAHPVLPKHDVVAAGDQDAHAG